VNYLEVDDDDDDDDDDDNDDVINFSVNTQFSYYELSC
jgi:hypothetical protein